MPEHQNQKMEWAVLVFASLILLMTVVVSFFHDTDTKPAFYLFGSIASFVFGATIIKKFK